MPAFPTNVSPGTPSTPVAGGGGGGSTPAWVALTTGHMSGGVKSSGTSVSTVNTAWSQADSRVSCSVTTAYADGIGEGYTWAVEATALLADLGVTEDQLRNGLKSLVVGMRQRSNPGLSALFGVAICRSNGETGAVGTLTGGGGGFRGHFSTATTVTPMGFDTTQDAVSTTYVAYASCAANVLLGCYKGYWKATASLQVTSQADLEPAVMNPSGFASRTDPLWLVLWAGNANTGIATTVDMDVSFAVVDGPNFAAVPA